MKKATHQTAVIFRKYKPAYEITMGDNILALFPYDMNNGLVMCYEHIGQHGEADYNHCINTLTRPARTEEYQNLKKELETIFGYNLKVIKRRTKKASLPLK